MLAVYLIAVVICLSEAEKCFQDKEAKLINGIKASLKTMQENMKSVHQMVEKLEVNIKEKSNICKKGWKEYKDHCYKYQNDKKSWRMAEKQCRTMGAYLVKIEDVSEHNWIVQNIKGGNLGSIWIGASDAGKQDWRWAFDLSKVTYSFFNPGQPDNGGNVEGCLELRSELGYKWNDFPCSSTNSYVCESQQEKEANLINEIKASLNKMQENMKGVHQMVEKLEVNIKEKSNICRKGWKEYKDHCYIYQSDKKSWRMAEEQCRTMGGYLVKIEDVSEHNWVVTNIKDGNLGSTWIGASDVGKQDWRWAFDLSKVKYSLWNPGQPDNGGNVEGCLELRSVFGYKWNDFPCSSTNSYVCESQQGVLCLPYSKFRR